ncbi:MAG: FtsH protease modulator HflK [Pseudomonadota bacterium]
MTQNTAESAQPGKGRNTIPSFRLSQAAQAVWMTAEFLTAATGRLVWKLSHPLFRRLPAVARGQVMQSNRDDGPPDLDELWRDFNRKLSGVFNQKGGGGDNNGPGGSMSPDPASAGIGLGVVVGLVALVWLGSGFFIVQEGQQAVVMQFGRFSHTAEAGFQWRAPYPFQSHEIVNLTQLRSVDVGSSSVTQGSGLRDSSMLTRDENIIDIQFTVQYRLEDARQYLFENKSSDEAVSQAAESAVREIVGASTMDSVLYEQRDAIAVDLSKSIQTQLRKIKAGVTVVNVNVKSVQAPEQVQAAFDDAFKAGADRERLKNEGQAYANDVIPKAQGTAARLREEAAGYSAKVVAQAEGDAQRFRMVLAEYQKAPAVTRDRLYIDTMQQIYSNVTKVMVDSRQGSNLLYLPLDKIMQQAGGNGPVAAPATPAASAASPSADNAGPASSGSSMVDSRSREGLRSRERDVR